MQSKIMIDIDSDGAPIIRLDYNHANETDDVRDKLIGRLLFPIHYCYEADGVTKIKSVDVSLELGHEDPNGIVAFIRHKKAEISTALIPERQLLDAITEMCQQSLPPNLYEQWITIGDVLMTTRKAFK